MYLQHFGLVQEPFSLAPDPHYLFVSERHREALAHLLYGVQGGGGFVLLSGEIGAGKTTVCRCFLEQVPAHCDVAYIFNPKLNAQELLQTICEEFSIALPAAGSGAKVYTDALNAHLLRTHAAGRASVLIIDEAQNLNPEVLEQLRLLTNLETNQKKLLQIVLIGQPELREMLQKKELEQLAQRVIARYHLGPLSAAETAQYVAHRLAVAGYHGAAPFSAAALKRIHALSAGVPRRINLLCHHALLGAYAQGLSSVSPAMVKKAAREVFGARTGWAKNGAWIAAAAAFTAAAAAAWVFRPTAAPSASSAPPAPAAPQLKSAPFLATPPAADATPQKPVRPRRAPASQPGSP